MNTRVLPFLTLFLFLFGLIAPITRAHANSADLKIRLENPKNFAGVKGTAKFRDRGNEREFQVEIENARRLAGAVLVVAVDNVVVGEITVDTLGRGRLSLNNRAGAIVPVVKAGSTVKVLTADSALVLNGKF